MNKKLKKYVRFIGTKKFVEVIEEDENYILYFDEEYNDTLWERKEYIEEYKYEDEIQRYRHKISKKML